MSQNLTLLNIFNYKLYKYSNRAYLHFVSEVLEKDLKDSGVKIGYLDKYLHTRPCSELFSVNNRGDVKFLNGYNLINFIYEDKCKINSLLNINIKNQKCYEIVRVVEFLQKSFLVSNNLKNLRKITHEDILRVHKILFNSFLSKPIISLVLNNTFYKDRDNQVLPLSYLVPKNHFLQYIRIRHILILFPFATDELIKEKLMEMFNIDISTVQVFKIRKRYFIANRFERFMSNNYQRFELYFSKIEQLTNDNIRDYINTKACYELISVSKKIYNYNETRTLYIGSTKNLYKRLNEYKNSKGHSSKMNYFLKNNLIYFRFISTDRYKQLETLLLKEFISYYGSMPVLNTNFSHK